MRTSEERQAGEEMFISLADYKEPAMPAQELLRTLIARVQALLVRHDPKPFIADDRLKKASMDTLDHVVAPPACGPLLAELDRTVAAWLGERPVVSSIKVIVIPPCDENAVVETWARQEGHAILDPPRRDDRDASQTLVIRFKASKIARASGLISGQGSLAVIPALSCHTRFTIGLVAGCNERRERQTATLRPGTRRWFRPGSGSLARFSGSN